MQRAKPRPWAAPTRDRGEHKAALCRIFVSGPAQTAEAYADFRGNPRFTILRTFGEDERITRSEDGDDTTRVPENLPGKRGTEPTRRPRDRERAGDVSPRGCSARPTSEAAGVARDRPFGRRPLLGFACDVAVPVSEALDRAWPEAHDLAVPGAGASHVALGPDGQVAVARPAALGRAALAAGEGAVPRARAMEVAGVSAVDLAIAGVGAGARVPDAIASPFGTRHVQGLDVASHRKRPPEEAHEQREELRGGVLHACRA